VEEKEKMDYSLRQMRTWKISGVGILSKTGGADLSRKFYFEVLLYYKQALSHDGFCRW